MQNQRSLQQQQQQPVSTRPPEASSPAAVEEPPEGGAQAQVLAQSIDRPEIELRQHELGENQSAGQEEADSATKEDPQPNSNYQSILASKAQNEVKMIQQKLDSAFLKLQEREEEIKELRELLKREDPGFKWQAVQQKVISSGKNQNEATMEETEVDKNNEMIESLSESEKYNAQKIREKQMGSSFAFNDVPMAKRSEKSEEENLGSNLPMENRNRNESDGLAIGYEEDERMKDNGIESIPSSYYEEENKARNDFKNEETKSRITFDWNDDSSQQRRESAVSENNYAQAENETQEIIKPRNQFSLQNDFPDVKQALQETRDYEVDYQHFNDSSASGQLEQEEEERPAIEQEYQEPVEMENEQEINEEEAVQESVEEYQQPVEEPEEQLEYEQQFEPQYEPHPSLEQEQQEFALAPPPQYDETLGQTAEGQNQYAEPTEREKPMSFEEFVKQKAKIEAEKEMLKREQLSSQDQYNYEAQAQLPNQNSKDMYNQKSANPSIASKISFNQNSGDDVKRKLRPIDPLNPRYRMYKDIDCQYTSVINEIETFRDELDKLYNKPKRTHQDILRVEFIEERVEALENDSGRLRLQIKQFEKEFE